MTRGLLSTLTVFLLSLSLVQTIIWLSMPLTPRGGHIIPWVLGAEWGVTAVAAITYRIRGKGRGR